MIPACSMTRYVSSIHSTIMVATCNHCCRGVRDGERESNCNIVEKKKVIGFLVVLAVKMPVVIYTAFYIVFANEFHKIHKNIIGAEETNKPFVSCCGCYWMTRDVQNNSGMPTIRLN